MADPYFKGLAKIEREPCCQPISKLEFEFERRRVTKEDIRELLYREILEYHPQLLKDYMNGSEGPNFLYPRLVTYPTLFVVCLSSNFSWGFNISTSIAVLSVSLKSSLHILRKIAVEVVQ